MCFALLLKAKPCPVEPVELKRGADQLKIILISWFLGCYIEIVTCCHKYQSLSQTCMWAESPEVLPQTPEASVLSSSSWSAANDSTHISLPPNSHSNKSLLPVILWWLMHQVLCWNSWLTWSGLDFPINS